MSQPTCSQHTQCLPSTEFSIQTNFHLSSIKLADPKFKKPGGIEMTFGLMSTKKLCHGWNSLFGWIASGKHPESQQTHLKITPVCIFNTFDLGKLWELGEIPPVKTQTAEDIASEQHFQDTTRVENNSFVVQMPSKQMSNHWVTLIASQATIF